MIILWGKKEEQLKTFKTFMDEQVHDYFKSKFGAVRGAVVPLYKNPSMGTMKRVAKENNEDYSGLNDHVVRGWAHVNGDLIIHNGNHTHTDSGSYMKEHDWHQHALPVYLHLDSNKVKYSLHAASTGWHGASHEGCVGHLKNHAHIQKVMKNPEIENVDNVKW